jgi:hypothetical protein
MESFKGLLILAGLFTGFVFFLAGVLERQIKGTEPEEEEKTE